MGIARRLALGRLISLTGGYLIGPLLGGVVLGAGASPSAVFAVDAATFVLSA